MSEETPRQLIERRLLEMAGQACDVIAGSIRSDGRVPRGQQTRSADAWRVIDALRGSEQATDTGATLQAQHADVADLAVARERLRLALRSQRSESESDG